VDGKVLIGNEIPFLNTIKESLEIFFPMKDLGEAAYILGIKIYRDRSSCLIVFIQSKYLDKVLKRFKMEYSKKGSLSVASGKSLSKKQCPSTINEREFMNNFPYASKIGPIMYDMICMCPMLSVFSIRVPQHLALTSLAIGGATRGDSGDVATSPRPSLLRTAIGETMAM
jgi:hypothetical protein